MSRSFVRDSTVRIAVRFFDVEGEVLNPDTATAVVRYQKRGCEQSETVSLALQDDKWIADWDSQVADPGAVYVHAKTGGAAPISSVDFEFRLTANRANSCEGSI